MTTLKTNKPIFMLLVLTLSSCIYFGTEEDELDYESIYEPIIMKRDAFNVSVKLSPPQPQSEMGKIYVKDNFLFISEPNKGFHIFNNSNPKTPEKLKFLKVPGSTDISIKSDVLYINNAVDLIAVTFNNSFNEVTVTKRIENVFPEKISPDGFLAGAANDEVVIDWKLKN